MLQRIRSLLSYGLNLFNPPPLVVMNRSQKLTRILVVTFSIVISCILLAMAGALGIFLFQRGIRMLSNVPQLESGLEIMLVSACVNTFCVAVLFYIRNLDRKVMGPPAETPKQA